MRATYDVMGTVASVAIADQDVRRLAAPAVRDGVAACWWVLRDADRRFSHYRADSEVSRWLRGEIEDSDRSADLLHVVAECRRFAEETDGAFRPATPDDGRLDTAGFVKGWATQRAADVLRDYGFENFMLGVGGDFVVSGEARPGEPWKVAIADPRARGSVIAVVRAADCAVATSGRSERGEHIWDASGGAPQADLLSLTVVGPDLVRADVYSTACFAMGVTKGLKWLESHAGFEGMALLGSGQRPCTTGFAALVAER